MSPRAVVVGAGLGGSLMAALLGRDGWEVDVLERRLDPRQTRAEEGRSINLALSERGIHALAQLGLADAVLSKAVPLRGRRMHAVDGSLTVQPYGLEGQGINSVSRSDLNRQLIDVAEQSSGVRIRFGMRCRDVDPEGGVVEAEDARTGNLERVSADLIIGADGAFSAVRARLARRDRFDFSQAFLEHAYKELTIPPAQGGGHRMEPNAMHIWPRGGYMMMAMANRDGSFTVTLYLPYAGADGFDLLRTPDDVVRFFEQRFPDAIPHIPDLREAFFTNPTGSLVTVRCAPWHAGGKVVLIGDAAHAVVPFYGQGANASFEDCLSLAARLREVPDRAAALEAYQADRKPNTDALADLAIDNFREMRDRVASPLFLFRKKFEKLLNRLMPATYIPLYPMISFTRIPYATARERAQRQWRIVRTALGGLLLVLFLAVVEMLWP